MSCKRGFSLWDCLWIVGILIVVAAILFPMFARTIDPMPTSHCQSQMNQLGKAIKSYMSDWDDHFPTNRLWKGKPNPNVPLTPDNPDDYRFKYGPNWVEALYPYVEKVGQTGDNATVWKCPKAGTEQVGGESANITYAFNFNLIEKSEGIIRDAGHTMLLREMDRCYGAVCRPINISKDGKTRPIGAFLTDTDPQLPRFVRTKSHLHLYGSNILFTDGHVKMMRTDLMPTDNKLVWDETAKQWWNAAEIDRKMIAITP